MDVIPSPVQWQFVLVCLNSNVVFSRWLWEHNEHVKSVLSHLRGGGATLKSKKCDFITGTIVHLGHVLGPDRLEKAVHTIDAIEGLQLPTNLTGICSRFGLRNEFLCFVVSFVHIAAPLNKKLKTINLRTLLLYR